MEGGEGTDFAIVEGGGGAVDVGIDPGEGFADLFDGAGAGGAGGRGRWRWG